MSDACDDERREEKRIIVTSGPILATVEGRPQGPGKRGHTGT